MLHAARLRDSSATIEHARLLWKDGHHRKAIQTLEGAIAANEFSADTLPSDDNGLNPNQHQNMLAARVWFIYTDNITIRENLCANSIRHIFCWRNGLIEPDKHSLML